MGQIQERHLFQKQFIQYTVGQMLNANGEIPQKLFKQDKITFLPQD